MSYWYPQAAVELRVLFEDYNTSGVQNPAKVKKINCVARDISISVNDYKTSDTFTLKIDFKNFPFDPRTVRACGVVIYLQDMGKPGEIITPGLPTEIDPTKTNAVFIGYADKESIDFDETNRVVTFEGRDNTSLLIDQKYITNKPLTLENLSLDVAIKSLISAFPATAAILVINKTDYINGVQPPLPILASYAVGFGDPLGAQKNPGKNETYWEIIQDMVSRAGLICYMGIYQNNGVISSAIYIASPRNQQVPVDQNGRPTNETLNDIKFIYGQNVKNLKFERKLGRLKGFNVQVRCRVGKDVLIAKIPENATAEWCKSYGVPQAPVGIPVLLPTGELSSNVAPTIAPYITFPIASGRVNSIDQLVLIGQSVFEQWSLQQFEGSFETHEMLGRGTTKFSSFDNKSSFKQYDLTQIRKGQSICFEIDSPDLGHISRLGTVAQRTKYLISRNYPKDIATLFAQTIGKFSQRFLIKSYTMDLSEQGFKLTVHFYSIIQLTNVGITQ
jgi:hypothetical protein